VALLEDRPDQQDRAVVAGELALDPSHAGGGNRFTRAAHRGRQAPGDRDVQLLAIAKRHRLEHGVHWPVLDDNFQPGE
jgi:hypothetical protein